MLVALTNDLSTTTESLQLSNLDLLDLPITVFESCDLITVPFFPRAGVLASLFPAISISPMPPERPPTIGGGNEEAPSDKPNPVICDSEFKGTLASIASSVPPRSLGEILAAEENSSGQGAPIRIAPIGIAPRPSTMTGQVIGSPASGPSGSSMPARKKPNRPSSYNKEESIFVPKRIMRAIDTVVLNAAFQDDKELLFTFCQDPEEDSEATAAAGGMRACDEETVKSSADSKPEGRGSYKCNLCMKKDEKLKSHVCPFIPIPRRILGPLRGHLPEVWQRIIDLYQKVDQARLKQQARLEKQQREESETSGSEVHVKAQTSSLAEEFVLTASEEAASSETPRPFASASTDVTGGGVADDDSNKDSEVSASKKPRIK